MKYMMLNEMKRVGDENLTFEFRISDCCTGLISDGEWKSLWTPLSSTNIHIRGGSAFAVHTEVRK
jgi:hypothetical protein